MTLEAVHFKKDEEQMKIYYNPKLKQLARNLRNNSTPAEIKLWNQLKARKMFGFQFMRQKPIGNYIVDFYCSRLALVIELDGESHEGKQLQDKEKDQWLEDHGISILRFTNSEVFSDMRSVLETIELWIRENNFI